MRISISWKREEPFFFITKAGFLIFFSIAKMSKKCYRFALEMCQKCLMKCLAHNRGTFSYFSFSVILGAKVSILSWKTNPFPTFLLQNVQARKKVFHTTLNCTHENHIHIRRKKLKKSWLISHEWLMEQYKIKSVYISFINSFSRTYACRYFAIQKVDSHRNIKIRQLL
mgnify:CR=1 FL=1